MIRSVLLSSFTNASSTAVPKRSPATGVPPSVARVMVTESAGSKVAVSPWPIRCTAPASSTLPHVLER